MDDKRTRTQGGIVEKHFETKISWFTEQWTRLVEVFGDGPILWVVIILLLIIASMLITYVRNLATILVSGAITFFIIGSIILFITQ